MIFDWLRDRRRRKILEAPFPDPWRVILTENVGHVAWLDQEEQATLRDLVQVFVAEKDWRGVGGLELTDEIRVTIAAGACLLILALPHDLYRKVRTILVYPTTVIAPPRRPGLMEIATAPVPMGVPILGQAHLYGPIILTWDAARHSARHPGLGHNVVFHEFAHALDMLDGYADGTPPLQGRPEYARWAAVCSVAFEELQQRTRRGQRSTLDAYGATNEAEFFAVATEAFFDLPVALRHDEPALYEVLSDFYKQDPAHRVERASEGTVG